MVSFVSHKVQQACCTRAYNYEVLGDTNKLIQAYGLGHKA